MLKTSEEKKLLAWAREVIQSKLEKSPAPTFIFNSSFFQKKLGVFVTLKADRKLRGCIGCIIGTKPLWQGVAEMALASAFNDPRFSPLDIKEWPKIIIEISVLTEPKLVNSVKDIIVGQHGLILKKGLQQGLLLPQVPLEQGWNLDQYLEGLCLKAGISFDQLTEVNLWSFEAQIFGEKKL